MDPLDLEKYLARIGYSGPLRVNLETLGRLQALHATSIPFENLDALLGRPVSLDWAAISKKFLDGGRGGYCFEQNTFFSTILKTLGFSVRGHGAVVQWNRADCGPRIHMVLSVDLPEGRFLVDVGFGRLTLTTPLRIEPDIEQPTTLEPFRMVHIGDDFHVEVKLGGVWTAVYRFSLQELAAEDYVVYNWFTSTHPDVVFTNHLMAARAAEKSRYGLFDNELSIHHLRGPSEKRILETAHDLGEALKNYFNVSPPAESEAILNRLTERHL